MFITYDSTDENLHMYINGKLSSTTALVDLIAFNDVKDRYTYQIGNNIDDLYFKGYIWDFHVYASPKDSSFVTDQFLRCRLTYLWYTDRICVA